MEKRFNEILKSSKSVADIFNLLGDLVFLMVIDGNSFRYIYINSAVKKLLHIEDNIQGKRIEDVVPSDSAKYLTSKYLEAIKTRKKIYFKEVINNKDGQYIGETALNPIISDNGECKYVLGIVREITERSRMETLLSSIKNDYKKAERELRKNEERFRIISENSMDMIKLVDSSGLVEYMSPSVQDITGYQPSDFIGKPYTLHYHEEDVSQLKQEYLDLLEGLEESVIEARFKHKNGHFIWLESTTKVIKEDGCVKQFVTISRDISERMSEREKLSKMAFYDYLTGIPNRRLFEDHLDLAINQARRSNKMVGVLLIDGNGFKQVNDTFGHRAGDLVIKEMANRLSTCVRDTDTVGRIGGDEMGIILPEIESEEVAINIANRVIEAIEKPVFYKDHRISIGAGVGIAFYPQHATHKRKLMRLTDEALYKAKESEKSKFMVY